MYTVSSMTDKWTQCGNEVCDTVYCKLFKVEKCCSCITKVYFAGKLLQLDGSLAWPRPTAQAISLGKLCGTDRSMKTAKLFHLE